MGLPVTACSNKTTAMNPFWSVSSPANRIRQNNSIYMWTRTSKGAAVAACSLLIGCATAIHVEGVLVQGDRQDITAEDVQQALAAARTDSPSLRTEVLRKIYVNGPDRIWLTFSSHSRGDESPQAVERIHGRWQATHAVWL